MVFLYFLAFVASMVLFTILICYQKNQRQAFYSLLFICPIVCNLGYFLQYSSYSIETCYTAIKVGYLAECYSQIFYLAIITKLCNTKLPKWAFILNGLLSFGVYILILSIGHTPMYYKSITLMRQWGAVYLKKEYGPYHNVFFIYLGIQVILQFAILIRAFLNKANSSYKNTLSLIMIELISFLSYLVQTIFHFHFSLLPFAYIISELFLLNLINKFYLFNVDENIFTRLSQTTDIGYLVFNTRFHYFGCNNKAMDFFPELKGLKLDSPIPPDRTEIQEKIITNLAFIGDAKETTFHVVKEGKLLKCTATLLSIQQYFFSHKPKTYGFIVEVIDDTTQQNYIKLLSNYNKELISTVSQKTNHIKEIQAQILMGISEIIESRDYFTGDHIKRTTIGVKILTEAMMKHPEDFNRSPQFYAYVIQAAPMHDIGKISVDDSILRKKTSLTDEEYEAIKNHATKGSEIIEAVFRNIEDDEFIEIAKNIAKYHHEKWDGKGYPLGLKGEDIPLESRIMALADVTDALLSKRVYKEAFTFEETFKLIETLLGTHFDPKLGKLFLEQKDKLIKFYSSCKERDIGD